MAQSCDPVEAGPAVEQFAAKTPAAISVRQTEPASRPSAWRQRLATALSMGACFLIALALGLSIRGNSSGGGHGPDSALTPTLATVPAPAEEVVSIESPNGLSESVEIPRVRDASFNQNLLDQEPDAMPPEVQQAFERSGHQVVQEREMVPVQMNDGRRLVVPVDHAEIHYVGRGSL